MTKYCSGGSKNTILTSFSLFLQFQQSNPFCVNICSQPSWHLTPMIVESMNSMIFHAGFQSLENITFEFIKICLVCTSSNETNFLVDLVYWVIFLERLEIDGQHCAPTFKRDFSDSLILYGFLDFTENLPFLSDRLCGFDKPQIPSHDKWFYVIFKKKRNKK